MSETQKSQRTVEGRVVSNKMDKTVTVLLERQVQHRAVRQVSCAVRPRCTRTTRTTSARKATSSASPSARPMSKTKNWRVVESRHAR